MSWNDAIELLSKATPKYTSGGFPLPGETVKPDPIVSPAVKEAKKTELVSNLHSQIRDSAAKKQAGIRDVKQKLNVPASYKGTVAEWKNLSPMAQYKAKGGAVASQATTKDIEGEKFKFKEPSTRSGKLKAKAASAIAAKEDKSSWGLGSENFITGSGKTGFGVDVPKAAKQVGTEAVVGALTSALGWLGSKAIKRGWSMLPAGLKQEGTKLLERGGKLSKPYLDKVEDYFTGKSNLPKESWGILPKGTPKGHKKTGSRDLNAPPTPSDIRRAAKAPLPKLEPKGPLRGKPGAAKGKGIGEAKTDIASTVNVRGAKARREGGIGKDKTAVATPEEILAVKKPSLAENATEELKGLKRYNMVQADKSIAGLKKLFEGKFKRRPASPRIGDPTIKEVTGLLPNNFVDAGVLTPKRLETLRNRASTNTTKNHPKLSRNSSEWGKEHDNEFSKLITGEVVGSPDRQEALITFIKNSIDKSWGEALDLLKSIYDPEALIPPSWAGALVIMKSI